MTKKIFSKRYQYDIGLEEGVGAHLVTWVTGLMVFFVTLALSAHFALNTLTQEWINGLSGSLTVEVRPSLDRQDRSIGDLADLNKKAEKILWLAKQHPAVASAQALPADEIRRLIEPWLGEKMTQAMPLPAVIDLRLNKNADVAKLQSDILNLVPEAAIDTHADTLDDVKTLITTARLFVLLLTSVIVALAVAAISGIVRSKFSIHKADVETLHLIGAGDEYIARQFRRHTLKGTLKGALIGLCCMIATLFAIGFVTGAADPAIFPRLRLSALEWIILTLSPLIAGSLVAHFTAQKTVMNELARLP